MVGHPRPLIGLTQLTPDDLHFIEQAANYLEHPGFLVRVANLVGKPAERLLAALPQSASKLVGEVTHAALDQSLDWAVRSLSPRQTKSTRRWLPARPGLHTALTATTGALGGMFGLAGAAVEIPATTALMLRSIAGIAASQGFLLDEPRTRLQCMSVFSFGSPNLEAMESAYFSTRLSAALAVRDAASYLARQSATEIGTAVSRRTAPVLVRFLDRIANRFEIVVTQKVAAQAVPLVGAAMGSLINAAFTDHFNRVAEFHFGILRLERKYGRELVREAYNRTLDKNRQSAA